MKPTICANERIHHTAVGILAERILVHTAKHSASRQDGMPLVDGSREDWSIRAAAVR